MFGAEKKIKDAAIADYSKWAEELMQSNPSLEDVKIFINSAGPHKARAAAALQRAAKYKKNGLVISEEAVKYWAAESASLIQQKYGDLSVEKLNVILLSWTASKTEERGIRVLLQKMNLQ